jgi:DNA gyrase subunit A
LAVASDDVLLATANGRAIRFPIDDVRIFVGRASVGVRGIRLLGDDTVISMAILGHQEMTPEVREAYLAEAAKRRRAMGEESAEATVAEGDDTAAIEPDSEEEPAAQEVAISEEQVDTLATHEQMLLSITENGFGMRTSAYDYRITGRGGQGVFNVAVSERRGKVVAVLLADKQDQIILATDGGMVIRTSVRDIRIVRRNKQGVVVFKVSDGERVVSVARLGDMGEGNGEAENGNGNGSNGGPVNGSDAPGGSDAADPPPSDSN